MSPTWLTKALLLRLFSGWSRAMPEKHDNRRAIVLGLGLSLALFVGGLLALPSAEPLPRQQAAPAAAPLKKQVPRVICHKTDSPPEGKPVNN